MDLDPTFAGDGALVASIGPREMGNAVAVQSDGKVLVAGSVSGTNSDDAFIVRYTKAGAVDTSFGTNGIARFDLGADERFDDLRIQSDGKILAGGSIDGGESLLVRLNSNGKPDTSFGTAGIALSAGVITRLDLQNGKIIAIGQNFVRRYTATGALDSSFGVAGAVNLATVFNQPNFTASGVTIQSDGKIIITGTETGQFDSNDKAFTIRLLANGAPDTGFSADGIVRNTADSASLAIGSIVQPSGKIVVLFSNGNDPSLVRYNADGSVDSTFNIPPTSLDFENVPLSDNNFSETVSSIVQQSDGKIVISGALHPANGPVLEIGIVRLTADGKPDTSFSSDGKSQTDFTGKSGFAGFADLNIGILASGGIAVDPGGNLVVIANGETFNGVLGDSVLGVARLMGNPLPASSHVKVVNGVLTITGTSGSDQISIDDTSATTFSIAFDGDTVTVARSGIKSIRVDLGDGDNVFSDSPILITLPMTVTAGAGNDLIMTGEGNDSISAGDGNDQIFAEGGNDTIMGGGGDDTIDGGAGADFMSGGAGNDTVTYASRSNPVYVGIGTLADDGEAGEHDNVYQDVETVIGGSGNDTIHGGTGDNLVVGNGGSDQLFGGAGEDTLMGNAGSGFVLSGTAGIDTLNGEAGTDTAINSLGDSLISIENNLPNGIPDRGPFNTQVSEVLGADGVLTVTGTPGADDVEINVSSTSQVKSVRVMLLGGNDYFQMTGSVPVYVDGGDGNDTLNLGGDATVTGPHTILGGNGNDTLIGGYGPDTLDGGAGADSMDGGLGDNTVDYSSRTANLLIRLDGRVGASGEAGEGDTISSVETVLGGSGNDRIIGTDAAEVLHGGGGNDTLFGKGGNDSLYGDAGNDLLDGGTGADLFHGGDGIDTADYSRRGEDLTIGVGTKADDGAAGEHDNVYNDIEKVIGGYGKNTISGTK